MCADFRGRPYVLANVPDEESLLASGMAPAREAESAGGMAEVPQGRGFPPSVCSDSFFSVWLKAIQD
jgi:hypothetical protein